MITVLSADTRTELTALAGRCVERHTRSKSTIIGDTQCRFRAVVFDRDPRAHHDALSALAAGASQQYDSVMLGERNGSAAVFVYSGIGGQWPGMASDLAENLASFASALARQDATLKLEGGVGLSPYLCQSGSNVGVAGIQQSLYGYQLALTETLESFGVVPGAVIGHSLGEVAAAVTAGHLSDIHGSTVIVARSKRLESIGPGGAMAVLGADARTVLGLIGTVDMQLWLEIAAENSNESTVLTGAEEAIDRIVQIADGRGLFSRRIDSPVAAHSRLVEQVLPAFRADLRSVVMRRASRRMYSTSSDLPEVPGTSIEYWPRNLRNPVRFEAAVVEAINDGYRIFLEVGPHPVLAPVIAQIGESKRASISSVSIARRGKRAHFRLLRQLCVLFCAGIDVRMDKVLANGDGGAAPMQLVGTG